MDILIVRVGGSKPREVPLVARRIEIGDAVAGEGGFAGIGLAPRHFALERIADGWKVVDLGSEAGTLVNGSFVVQKLAKPGDRIEAGGVVFEIAVRPDAVGAESASESRRQPGRPADPAVVAPPPRASAPAAPPENPFQDVLFPSARAAEVPSEPIRSPSQARPPSGVGRGSRAGSGTGHRSAARRRARNFVSMLLFSAVIVVVGVVVAWRQFGGRSGGGLELGKERLALAVALREVRDFERAKAVLAELELAGDSGVSPNAVRLELDAIERDRTRLENASVLARQLLAERDGDPAARLERIARAKSDYGDTPSSVEFSIAERAAQRALRERESVSGEPIVARLERARANALAGQFGGALAIYREIGRSELTTDRFVSEHGAAMVEAGAKVVAETLLTRLRQSLANDDLLGASIAADEEMIAGLRGTALSPELEQVADVVAMKLKAMPNRGGLVPIPDRSRSDAGGEPGIASGEGSRGATGPGSATPAASSFGAARSALSAIEKQLLREADALFASGDVEGANSLYERSLASAASAAKPVFEQRLERSRRALGFLSSLLAKIAESQKAVASLEVRTKDGASGRISGVSHGMLVLVTDDAAEREILPSELAPASCLALAGKLKWTPAESLERASFALLVGDAKEIDVALTRAAEDGNNKAAIDALIASWRGLDEVPEWGFFRVDGQWITFKEREERLYAKEVRDAVAKLDRGDKAWDEGIAALNELLPVAPKVIAEELAKRREKMLLALVKQPEWKAFDELDEKRKQLEEARKHALELIFDEVKYFYPYSPPAVPPDMQQVYQQVQREVDARVERVRAIWGDEHGEAPKGVALSPQFQKLVKMLLGERPLLAIADPDRRFDEPTAERLDLLPAGLESVTIRDVAIDYSERARLDQDREVLALNLKITTSGTAQELDQIRITNEYRRMMGRRALAVNEKLMRSSRVHSEWMSRTGKFSHTNDEDPTLASPGQRMAAQGYTGGGGGENLANNPGGPMGAHNGWKHSSGHHRNLLWEGHSEMGVGAVGNLWTQNFGGGTEYSGNLGGAGN